MQLDNVMESGYFFTLGVYDTIKVPTPLYRKFLVGGVVKDFHYRAYY